MTIHSSGALAVTAAVLYFLGFLFLGRRAASTGALTLLTLPPLLIMDFAAWVAAGRAARTAAGYGEAMWLMHFGGFATILMVIGAAVESRSNAAISNRRPALVVPAICWLVSYAAFAMPALRLTGFAAWNVVLACGFLSLVLLVVVAVSAAVAYRYAMSRRNQLVALGITALLGAIQTAIAWYLM